MEPMKSSRIPSQRVLQTFRANAPSVGDRFDNRVKTHCEKVGAVFVVDELRIGREEPRHLSKGADSREAAREVVSDRRESEGRLTERTQLKIR